MLIHGSGILVGEEDDLNRKKTIYIRGFSPEGASLLCEEGGRG